MENAMTYGMESKLRLPSCFVEVTDDEMEYVEGGVWWLVALKTIKFIGAGCLGVGTGIGAGMAASSGGMSTGGSVAMGIISGIGAAIVSFFSIW